MPESCLVIAGEKSGEEHALSFFSELRKELPSFYFFGVGGKALEEEGLELLYDFKDFSSWGFSEVINKIPFYLKARKKILSEVQRRNCRYAILIDFQTFNLTLAKTLSIKGVKVLYYVAPQAWVWKSYRVKPLKRYVDSLYCILPFEKKWFRDRGVKQTFSVPHPIYQRYKKEIVLFRDIIQKKNPYQERVNLVVLPGSRVNEIRELLPLFIECLEVLKKDYDLVVHLVLAGNVDQNEIRPFKSSLDHIHSDEELGKVLSYSHIALAASGTVTLATALFEVPTVVCYKSSFFNEFVYSTFVDYEGHVSLANIVQEKEVFPELIQERATTYNILKVLRYWLGHEPEYKLRKSLLTDTAHKLSGEIKNVANNMANCIKS